MRNTLHGPRCFNFFVASPTGDLPLYRCLSQITDISVLYLSTKQFQKITRSPSAVHITLFTQDLNRNQILSPLNLKDQSYSPLRHKDLKGLRDHILLSWYLKSVTRSSNNKRTSSVHVPVQISRIMDWSDSPIPTSLLSVDVSILEILEILAPLPLEVFSVWIMNSYCHLVDFVSNLNIAYPNTNMNDIAKYTPSLSTAPFDISVEATLSRAMSRLPQHYSNVSIFQTLEQ